MSALGNPVDLQLAELRDLIGNRAAPCPIASSMGAAAWWHRMARLHLDDAIEFARVPDLVRRAYQAAEHAQYCGASVSARVRQACGIEPEQHERYPDLAQSLADMKAAYARYTRKEV
jgi:hypothetical protein